MLEILPESQGNILGIKATERVTDGDYKIVLIPHLEEILHKYEKARFLFLLAPTLEGFEIGAMWDDARFGLQHRNDFEKICLVGGPRWTQWIVKLSEHFMSGQVKTFSVDQLQEAWDWVKS